LECRSIFTNIDNACDHKYHAPKPQFGFWHNHVHKSIGEPSKRPKCSGIIVREDDDRIWLVEPSQHFIGNWFSIPKGLVEKNLTPQQNALKEVYEESGLVATIDDYLCDVFGNRFYVGKRVKGIGSPHYHDWETQAVHLVTVNDAARFFNYQNKKIQKFALLVYQAWLLKNPQR
jgi:8-oxo-dGTP pyrophosphatase MutT (NUDIX family)